VAENQNIEYKSSWRDEYLKWICGFANASGGTLFIGIDDNGKIVGIADAKKLLEDIPNKVRDLLGIIIDVNLCEKSKKEYLEIKIDSYPFPISYKGQYHIRSGSTKQELKGAALDKFLLEKKGKRWDGVPIPKVGIKELKISSLELYKSKASQNGRCGDTVLTDSTTLLLQNLGLIEGTYLKRAALLLFHPTPQKFFTGASVKIGYFESDDKLVFQDEIKGNLIDQVEEVISLLFTKYLKAHITYQGLNRIEKFDYPYSAIREGLLNAVCHKDYAESVPIQISVYDDHLIIWNNGQLPNHWTIKTLETKHPSIPFNPDIANAFFKCGYIESWGRGTINMINESKAHGIPKPEFRYDFGGLYIRFRKYKYDKEMLSHFGLNYRQIETVIIIMKDKIKISNSWYQEQFSVSKRTASHDLTELVEQFNLLGKSNSKGRSVVYEMI
jgi:ATP-dependent DNA helicase RecG